MTDRAMSGGRAVLTEAYVRTVAAAAYVWAWPMVNMHNRRLAFSQIPEPGLMGGVMRAAR